MNVEDFRDLYEYNHKVRESYLEYIQKNLSWFEVVKNRETAWLSIKDTLLHIIWTEDSWVHYSIQGLEDPRRPFPFNAYQNWQEVLSYNNEVIAKTQRYFTTLTELELNRKVSRINKDGIRRTIAVRDVLFHIFTEELHHRGEIIATMWQMNIEPPDMGWPSVMNKTVQPWRMS